NEFARGVRRENRVGDCLADSSALRVVAAKDFQGWAHAGMRLHLSQAVFCVPSVAPTAIVGHVSIGVVGESFRCWGENVRSRGGGEDVGGAAVERGDGANIEPFGGAGVGDWKLSPIIISVANGCGAGIVAGRESDGGIRVCGAKQAD